MPAKSRKVLICTSTSVATLVGNTQANETTQKSQALDYRQFIETVDSPALSEIPENYDMSDFELAPGFTLESRSIVLGDPPETPIGTRYLEVNREYNSENPKSRRFLAGKEVPQIGLGRITQKEIELKFEFAKLYLAMISKKDCSQEKLAKFAGLSTGSVSNIKLKKQKEKESKGIRQRCRVKKVAGVASSDFAAVIPDSCDNNFLDSKKVEQIVEILKTSFKQEVCDAIAKGLSQKSCST